MKDQENIDMNYSKMKTIFEYLKNGNKTKVFKQKCFSGNTANLVCGENTGLHM